MNKLTTDKFTSWTKRIRKSDHEAFAELYRATNEALLRYAWQLTHTEDAARDIVQEAYLKLWSVRNTLDPKRSLKSLLYTIVHNRAINYRRDRRQLVMISAADGMDWEPAHNSTEEQFELNLLNEQVHNWVEEMPPRRREAFLLSRMHDLSHQEIAEIMQLSPGTVNKHIVLGLNDLRNRLDPRKTRQKSRTERLIPDPVDHLW